MKQAVKSETDILGLINKIQAQLIALDKKIDTLVGRSLPQVKPSLVSTPTKERVMYKAICADCHKECSIPFKPSGDRPVYCQDCFSRRKVINLSGYNKPKEALANQTPALKETDKPKAKAKKKAVTAKKKVAPKKK